jgi:hypothetical protein
MKIKPLASDGKRRVCLLLGVIALVALLLPAIPARALVGVTTTDNNAHRYVGAVWRLIDCCDENGNQYLIPNPDSVRASGILIAPNVVLTAGRAFDDGELVAVSFASPVTDLQDYGKTVHRGYVFWHPKFGPFQAFPGSYNHDNDFNMAVIILEDAVQGIAPTNLADIGALDALKGTPGPTKQLTAVGYGTTESKAGNQERTWDFTRRAATWELSGLKPSYVHTTAPGQHGPCNGDQGGPIMAKNSDEVAAIISNWDGVCGGPQGVGYGYRVDTQDAYDFLCFVSKTDLDDEQIKNPNAPVITGNFVDYPDVAAASQAKLADYCSASESTQLTASADDGGAQSADRPQQSTHKHKNTNGKHHNKGHHKGRNGKNGH